MKLGGQHFSVEALEPFGEEWVPNREVLMSEFLNNDGPEGLKDIVAAIKAASGLVVIPRSRIYRRWREVPGDPLASIAHTDAAPFYGPVAVQMLHSRTGRDVNTAYTRHSDLKDSSARHLPELKALVEQAPPWIREQYRLPSFLDSYSRPGGAYYHGLLDPLNRMISDFVDEKTHLPELAHTVEELYQFFFTVSNDATQYVHSWKASPRTTVLSYQDPREEFKDEDQRVFHFRKGDPSSFGSTPLHRDLILHSGPGDQSYLAYSTYLKRMSRR